MAKQLVSPVERHIEKVVLGVAGLALLGAVAMYLVSTPNQIELDGQRVTPQTLDEVIFSKADRIRQRIRDANATAENPEPLVDEFAASLEPLDRNATWPLVTAVRPPVPLVDKPGQVAGQYELVEVLPLPKPAVTYGRSTYSIQRESGPAFVPANWVTVSSVVDVREQTSRQRLAYGVTRSELIYGPLEAQRRVQRSDGSWSDDDWKNVKPWHVGVELPEEPTVTFHQADGRAESDPIVMNKLVTYEEMLGKSEVQLEMLRPLIPVIENGTEWTFPIITSCHDVLKQDDEINFPDEEPAPEPDDRYGLCGVVSAVDVASNAAAKLRQIFDTAAALLEQAKKTRNPDDAMRARNMYNEVLRDNSIGPAEKQKATSLQAVAEQAAKDIERQNRRRTELNPDLESEDADIERPAREKLPIQQVWVSDARPGSVGSGRTYQYRVRQKLYNRLVGDPVKFREPEDAKLLFVAGAWSQPSDPVVIPRDVEYYVVSQDPRDGKVGVKISQWYEGVWVESRKFQLSAGDPIGGEVRVEVPDLDDPRKADLALVEFHSDGVLLDLDFDRVFRDRKRGGGRDGVRFGDRVKGVCEVALVDSNGALHERYLPVDKDDPSLRAAQARKWKPSKK